MKNIISKKDQGSELFKLRVPKENARRRLKRLLLVRQMSQRHVNKSTSCGNKTKKYWCFDLHWSYPDFFLRMDKQSDIGRNMMNDGHILGISGTYLKNIWDLYGMYLNISKTYLDIFETNLENFWDVSETYHGHI